MWVAFAYADGNCNCNANCNRNAKWDANSYSKCHWNCNADPYTVGNSTYANAAASPDTSASPVGPCISAALRMGSRHR